MCRGEKTCRNKRTVAESLWWRLDMPVLIHHTQYTAYYAEKFISYNEQNKQVSYHTSIVRSHEKDSSLQRHSP